MLRNYFKIALRNLRRNKAFSYINIFGLSIGMASAILIFLWIQNEISYDQFHTKKDRIYEGWNKAVFSDELHCWSTTPKALARALEKELPEVEQAVRVDWGHKLLFTVGEKKLTPTGNVVDSNFLSIFSFPLKTGSASSVLKDPHSIVLTEKLARKIYGDENPIGKVIKIDNKDNFTVTGIVK